MLNTKDNFKQTEMNSIQQESLFTELTPEVAAVIDGSGRFSESINFDAYDSTKSFYVPAGGNITLATNTRNIPSSGRNPGFFAAIRNVRTGNINRKPVSVGRDTTTWTGVNGGDYRIVFTDTRDGVVVNGRANVSHT